MRISLIRQEGNYSLRLPKYYDTWLLNPQQTENRRIDTRPVLITNILLMHTTYNVTKIATLKHKKACPYYGAGHIQAATAPLEAPLRQ